MEFKIPKKTQLIIDAWRKAAAILESVDMDEYEYVHHNDDDLISGIDMIAKEMRKIADEIESEQGAFVEDMEKYYNKKYSKNEDDSN